MREQGNSIYRTAVLHTPQTHDKRMRCENRQYKNASIWGGEHRDHNLVVAQADGRPYEGRMILKDFQDLRAAAGLPNVVFHSLRHTSTTYKLKLNNGDLKATQGDTGHAELDMITKVYAHILDAGGCTIEASHLVG